MDKSMLLDMRNELSHYKHDKDELRTQYITERLNKSLQTYYCEIGKSLDYLKNRDQDNLMRKL